MTSGPSPCSATCRRMPFVSIMRCVTSGAAGSTQGSGWAPAVLVSGAAARDGAAMTEPRVSAPAAHSMSRRDSVASRMVLFPWWSLRSSFDIGVTLSLSRRGIGQGIGQGIGHEQTERLERTDRDVVVIHEIGLAQRQVVHDRARLSDALRFHE